MFVGLDTDTVMMELCLAVEKLQRCRQDIRARAEKKSCTRLVEQLLTG